MDQDGPLSLCELCLKSVCENLSVLCTEGSDGSLEFRTCPVFPQELSDLLLYSMLQDGVLNDRSIGVFRRIDCLRLKRVCIRSCRISPDAFQKALCCHLLKELDASRLHGNITVSDIMQGLLSSAECRRSVQRLVLTGLDLYNSVSSCGSELRFSSLRALRSLDVSGTQLDDTALVDICSLPLLDCLDISGTAVTDLAPLLSLKSQLWFLSAHGLQQLDTSVLPQLTLLRHLDISIQPLDTDSSWSPQVDFVQLLENPDVLPVLQSLDVSGCSGLSDAMLQGIVVKRRELRFLGLLATAAGASDFLSGEGHLKVAAEHNLTQLCEALRRYRERETLLQRALFHLRNLSNQQDFGCQPAVLELVLIGMQTHSASAGVQLISTACVFNLTILELAFGMPQKLLRNVVQQVIITMKNFPKHDQIQKNCLLALCSDHILQKVPFNRYDAAKQVMMCLSLYEDQNLQRMAVTIVSLLVSKLSVEEIGLLGAEEFIIKQLLNLVERRASVGTVDSTLRFALSALWNLTDQTPHTCSLFLHNHGLELYTEILETYFFDSSVQLKVLGLLNNVAEVEDLREQLMDEDLLDYVLNLLCNPEVEVGVSYFAGGILANLTSNGGPVWELDIERHSILHKLHSSVMSWTPPDQQMVSYRSFEPFYALLDHSQPSGVQLWALWGIQFVTRQKVSDYSSMLEEEGGLEKLRDLASDPDVHTDVHKLTFDILHLVETHKKSS